MPLKRVLWAFLLALVLPFGGAVASEGAASQAVGNFTGTVWGILAVVGFLVSYYFVIVEEKTHLKKSIPVIIAAGFIWTMTALAYMAVGDAASAEEGFSHALLEYAQLFLFLLAAMTYVNTLQERNVFEVIRFKLLNAGLSRRTLFWVTGLAAFFLSPVLDNLTTALVMCSVAIAVGGKDKYFVGISAINIVIAANAGGAYSPFGDITTLMVWQAGHVEFFEFFTIFLPSLTNWVVPAFFMSLSIKSSTVKVENEPVALKPGAVQIMGLFFLTIVMAVTMHQVLHLPSMLGMMVGLGLLKLYGWKLSHHERSTFTEPEVPSGISQEMLASFRDTWRPRHKPFDTFVSVKRAEWDTLLFFFGVVMAVAGLSQLGYLAYVSQVSYGVLGATWTNSLVGIISAVVDNIPVMYAILQMNPDMVHGQWMLVTLTAGVGGSLLSVGSAAGVALMGFAKVKNDKGEKEDAYTFFLHLRWTPVIFLGYVASIIVHILVHPDVNWPF